MEQFSKKDLKKLIGPLILEQVLAIAVGFFDTVMVSSVGETAVSGVSLVDMINQLAITIFAALATGGAVIASQYIGQKREEKACQAANQLMLVMAFISCVVLGLCLIFRAPILRLFFGSIEAEVMNSALIYFMISALSYPFLGIYNAGAALFRSMGNSKITLIISGVMNVLNILFNSIFIFGLHMGVAGAAIGSLIARGFSALIIFLLISNKHNQIHLISLKRPMVDMKMVKKILYIGIPNGVENGIFQLGRILVVSIIAGFGTVQIAANAVANVFDGIGIIPGSAISLAMITVVGQCVGAGDYEQARSYAKRLLKITYLAFLVLDGAMVLGLDYILQIYSLSPETIALAKLLIIIHAVGAVVLWPLSFVLPNALRASNDVKFTMRVSVFSMCAFRIVCSLILGVHFGLGAIGVWIAMEIDWVFRSVMFVARFLGDKWQKVKLI